MAAGIPTLRSNGKAVQLEADGKPYLVLGGEVHNSSSSSLAYMAPVWPHMVSLNLNTVLVPVSWELVEPVEGTFDFTLVDGLILAARDHNLRLVILWFGSWKNGMSSYAPLWVKADCQRFPLVRRKDGSPVRVMSTLCDANRQADANAFASLMRHLREFDGQEHTVLMIQVENEVGVLGDSRDRSDVANRAFAGPVPPKLMEHLAKAGESLVPQLESIWASAGKRSSGTWETVFGEGPQTDEIFMAWNYAQYVDNVVAAGKAQHPIPMFVNAWLNEPGSVPGNYPSGGPLAHVIDVWQAGAPHIDLLAPDIYAANFQQRCSDFTQRGNTLFIPEMPKSVGGARNMFYAIGNHNALGTSPFGIDNDREDAPVAATYDILRQIVPEILQGQQDGAIVGFVVDSEQPQVSRTLGEYELTISTDSLFGRMASEGAGIVIATGPNEFLGAGSGFRIAFRPLTPGASHAGIGIVEEGVFQNGKWTPGRILNGDETEGGNAWRFNGTRLAIEKCRVFRYE